MEILTVYDGAGRQFEIFDYKGFRWPTTALNMVPEKDPVRIVDSVRTMKVRDDDVFICNYAKSGTHWIWEIVSMVVRGKAEYEKMSKQIAMLEIRSQEDLERLASPRVINTHLAVNLLPTELFDKRKKIIHLLRNPKDVAVSMYHMSKSMAISVGTFEEYYPLVFGDQRMMDCWFQYELGWENLCQERPDLPILNLYFEDLKENPVREVRKIAEFLEIPLSQETIEGIATRCDFENLKKANEEIKEDLAKVITGGNIVIYRKGEVGDWKNFFTVALNERFDIMYQEKMKNSKLTFRFTV